MFWTSAVVLYLVIWFMTLFVVLPIGYRDQQEEDGEVVPGTPPGAPSTTNYKRKFLWTTIAGTLIWGAAMVIILNDLVPLEVFDIITAIHQQGKTVLLVEQNAYASLKIADYAYVLEVGSVVLEGTGEALISDPRVREAYLGG